VDIKIVKVDNNIEALIVIGLIVDDEFIKSIHRAIKPEYFNTSMAKTISGWCMEYFRESDYKHAPKQDILDIYTAKKHEIPKEERAIQKKQLDYVLNMYKHRGFSRKYIETRALAYLKTNALKIYGGELKTAIDRNDVDKIIQLQKEKIIEIFDSTSKFSSIYKDHFGHGMFQQDTSCMFKFPGAIGEYLHPIRRGKTICMLGPAKRAKSFWLIEWAYQAMCSGLHVAFFSLEMDENEVETRLSHKITGMEYDEFHKKRRKEYLLPVLDCKKNQDDSCRRKECTSKGTRVIDEHRRVFEFDKKYKHVVCTACQGKSDRFEATSWFEIIKKRTLTKNTLDKHIKNFLLGGGKGDCKIFSYPIGTVSIKECETTLSELEMTKSWIPDVIIFDYIGILKEDPALGDKRIRIGENWKEFSRMIKTRNCLGVSVAQGNRSSANKDHLTEEDIGEDYSIMQTVDALIGINEIGHTEKQKTGKDAYWQRQRIDIIDRRYASSRPGQMCMTLNNFEIGQICLDSALI